MKLPDYVKLAALLNTSETHKQALNALAFEGAERSSETLRALLPYLSLSTLLSLRQTHADALGPVIYERLYDLIDAQRDWVVSPGCPTELRDSYLVCSFGKEWDLVKDGMTAIAADKKAEIKKGLVLDSSKFTAYTPQAQPCPDLATFQQKLKQATGDLLEKLDWNNVVLGGGAVLSILTGKSEDEAYKNSDVDLFLFGLQPDKLIPKVNSIIEQIQAALPPKPQLTETVFEGSKKDGTYRTREIEVDETSKEWRYSHQFDWDSQYRGELLIVKGFSAITLVPPRGFLPRRSIQIVLQSHATAFDALAWFDLDACAVGYTGNGIIALPRAVRSLSLGDWVGGVNFFDPKLGRKGDASASTAASRALKYLPRGFSLALPPAALRILEQAEIRFTEIIKNGKDRAKHDADSWKLLGPSVARTDEFAGLAGLLHREANLEQTLPDASKPADRAFGLDYGFKNSSWLKPITEDNLKTSENGFLAHDYWQYHLNEVAPRLNALLIDVDQAVAKGETGLPGAPAPRKRPGWTSGPPSGYAEYAIPYIPSFDREFVLGLKEKGDDPFRTTYMQIRDIQMPVSLIPIVEKAEQKMEKLLAGGADAVDAPASVPMSTVEFPELSTKVGDAINALFSDASDRILSPIGKTGSLDASEKFLPESFPGPCRRTKPPVSAQGGGKHMMTPLTGVDGHELKPKKDLSHVFRVATIAGLWHFRGLDEDIDKALNLIWHAWSNTARAAVSLPAGNVLFVLFLHGLEKAFHEVRRQIDSGDTTRLAETLGKLSESQRAMLNKCLEQRSTQEIVVKMNSDLAGLGQMIEALEGNPTASQTRVGEWDEQRRRFLTQWMNDEEMI
ncbi:hypothetical protein RHOSPDRAFT_33141 [Rhodotorula sp. JG-1b]|nr:hypothetical protein RHOSPDRAFT_33141 [Rhodotorula sp. JG-1b]